MGRQMTGVNFMRTYQQRKMAADAPPKTCKFIEGERPYGPQPYCDKPTVENSSYCPYHHRVCFKPFDETAAKGFTRWATK